MNEDEDITGPADDEDGEAVEFALVELRLDDGGDPDAIHEFLIECFLDDGDDDREPFVSWSLEELNAMLAQCARKASCHYPEDDAQTDEDALDLIEQTEEADE